RQGSRGPTGGRRGTVIPTSPICFFFSSRRRHTRFSRDWSSDVSLPISDTVWAKMICKYFQHGDKALNIETIRNRFTSDKEKPNRSEERRVGKECRSRWPQYDEERTGDYEDAGGESGTATPAQRDAAQAS